jgi:hypothetical protein
MTEEKRDSIGGRGKKRGLMRTVVGLEPEQVEVLRREAMERMVERKVGRMDAGEVVREAVDTWVRVKGDPVLAAQERAQEAVASGDAAAAKKAIEEWRRLADQRISEIAARLREKGKGGRR